MRAIPYGQATANAQTSPAVNSTDSTILAAATTRINIDLENPTTNTAIMYFKFDGAATVADHEFYLAPGDSASLRAANGDYTQGALHCITDTAGSQDVMVTAGT